MLTIIIGNYNNALLKKIIKIRSYNIKKLSEKFDGSSFSKILTMCLALIVLPEILAWASKFCFSPKICGREKQLNETLAQGYNGVAKCVNQS